MSSVVIRDPRAGDAADIASLLRELGYSASPEEVPARLESLDLDGTTSVMWIAELDGRAVGMATARRFGSVHQSLPVVQLTVLVVARAARGNGIGKRLVREAEEWAKQQGAGRITLTSALHREEAHEFYKRIGYEHTGVRLAKTFSGTPAEPTAGSGA